MSMSKIGRIKLMTRGLSSKELHELQEYCRKKASKIWRQERDKRITDLGIGGRVVYSATSLNFPLVVGQVGTITKIYKKRDRTLVNVEFDNPVWESVKKIETKDFQEWWDKNRDRIIKEVKRKGYKQFWGGVKRIYQKETEKVWWIISKSQGNTLIRIRPSILSPATKENIEMAQRTKETQPMVKALNKVLSEMS